MSNRQPNVVEPHAVRQTTMHTNFEFVVPPGSLPGAQKKLFRLMNAGEIRASRDDKTTYIVTHKGNIVNTHPRPRMSKKARLKAKGGGKWAFRK